MSERIVRYLAVSDGGQLSRVGFHTLAPAVKIDLDGPRLAEVDAW